MENYDTMKEHRRRVTLPSFIPRLFVAPSCLPKFTATIELIAGMKAQLSSKTLQLKELMSMHTKDDQECMEDLEEECFLLRSEIHAVECEANVMRKELVQRIYLEVKSEKEMMAVNDLISAVGVGAIPGMQCFEGKICLSSNLSEDVSNGIMNVQRLKKTF